MLEKRNTHPDLTKILIRSIRAYLSQEKPSLNWTPSDQVQTTVKEAFYVQDKIGWKGIFTGHLGNKWRQAQQEWYDQLHDNGVKVPRGQTGLTWAKALLQKLMHFALNRWQIRNETYHENQTREQYNEDRENMTNEIKSKYEGEFPQHPAIDRLMRIPEEELTSGPNGPMRAWLNSYELIMKYLAPRLITSFLT